MFKQHALVVAALLAIANPAIAKQPTIVGKRIASVDIQNKVAIIRFSDGSKAKFEAFQSTLITRYHQETKK